MTDSKTRHATTTADGLVERLRRHADGLIPFVPWVPQTTNGLIRELGDGTLYGYTRQAARTAALILDLREAAEALASRSAAPQEPAENARRNRRKQP